MAVETNALRGMAYLSKALAAAGGDTARALAGYNGGISLVGWDSTTWPEQTRRYVRFGAPIYEDAEAGRPSSPALDEWYEKLGVSLCRRAAGQLGL